MGKKPLTLILFLAVFFIIVIIVIKCSLQSNSNPVVNILPFPDPGWASYVDTAGDVDGDGLHDILFSASGDVYLIFGGNYTSNDWSDWYKDRSKVKWIQYSLKDYSLWTGIVLKGNVDIDNDGKKDLIIANTHQSPDFKHHGEVWVIQNISAPYPENHKRVFIDKPDEPDIIYLASYIEEERFGCSIAVIDLNKDGNNEICIGASGWSDPLNENAMYQTGGIYIFQAEADVDKVKARKPLMINGENRNDHFGSSMCAGDFNNDGYEDLAVGAIWANNFSLKPEIPNAGKVNIFYGGESFNYRTAKDADIILYGSQKESFFGCSIDSGNFIDDGGYSDLLIGAYGHDSIYGASISVDSGAAYVISGYDMFVNAVEKGLKEISINELINSKNNHSIILQGKYNEKYHQGDYFGTKVCNGKNFFKHAKDYNDTVLICSRGFDNPSSNPNKKDIGIIYAFDMNDSGRKLHEPDFTYFDRDTTSDMPCCLDIVWIGKIDSENPNLIATMSKSSLILLKDTN